MLDNNPSAPSQDNPYEAYLAELNKSMRWEQALAIAGYTGGNIVRLRPRNTTPALEAAMGYALVRGWATFPANLEDGEKKSYLAAKYAPGGKNWGMTDNWDQLQRNFTNANWRLKCGVGVPTGGVNGIFVIEADTLKGHGVDGIASLEQLEGKHGKLPDTLMAASPSGSVHRYYRHPGRGIKIKCTSSELAPGVDIKGDGGMVIAPPSVRADGEYRWLNNLPIAEAPQWLIDLINEPVDQEGGAIDGPAMTSEDKQASPDLVAAALAVIPNSNTPDTYAFWEKLGIPTDARASREYWVRICLATKGAAGEEGAEAFKVWSRKWPHHSEENTATLWASAHPTRIGAGTLFELANMACPGWREAFNEQVWDEWVAAAKQTQQGQTQQGQTQQGQTQQGETQQGEAKEREWPRLSADALTGLPGEVVALYAPHSEADLVALLILFLLYFGNVIGRGVYWQTEDTQHFTNLYVVLVGDTSEGRKGTAADRIRQFMKWIDLEWTRKCVKGGLSSGEGLVWEIRDAIIKQNKDGNEVVEDKGVDDKRLLVDEREFSRALTVAKREGNTLTDVMRNFWDGREYVVGGMTRKSKGAVTKPHVSVNGHITEGELRSMLDSISVINGYANRYLFLCVRRSKFLPFGGTPDPAAVMALQEKVQAVFAKMYAVEKEIPFDAEASDMWDQQGLYCKLNASRPGVLGAMCARAAPQVRRLAMLYAVLDGCDQANLVHLKAALAVWQYCEDSVKHIFGDALGESVADAILNALRSSGGMSRTQIRDLLGRNQRADKIDAALAELKRYGLARSEMRAGGGRGGPKVEFWLPT